MVSLVVLYVLVPTFYWCLYSVEYTFGYRTRAADKGERQLNQTLLLINDMLDGHNSVVNNAAMQPK